MKFTSKYLDSLKTFSHQNTLLEVWRRGERKILGGEKYRGKLRNLLYFLKEYFFRELQINDYD